MKKIKHVLITGAAGYIGSTLTKLLLNNDYNVTGIDKLMFGDSGIQEIKKHPKFKFIEADLKKVESFEKIFDEVDAIVHLAAIVGDPACAKEPRLATKTNWLITKKVFDYAQTKKNIQRFIFSSTCSNYGKMIGKNLVNESSSLNPVSLYAELKVKFEKYLLSSKTSPTFIPTALRFATVYGLSPRMRFDLTVNEFTREIALGNQLTIYGEQFWRPYCHVQDLARGCLIVLESDPKLVNHEVFNVGETNENYTKKMLADLLLEINPKAIIKFVSKNEDPRDYRVNFDKIKNKLNYKISKTVLQGMEEIFNAIKNNKFPNPYSKNYSNI